MTLRDHLAAIAQRSAFARAELEGPELPQEVAHYWHWFVELHAGRSSNGYGPNPIAYSDIEAWSRLTRTPLEPRDVDALRAIDTVWITWRSRSDDASQR